MTNISGDIAEYYKKITVAVKQQVESGKSITEIQESFKEKYDELDINVALANAGVDFAKMKVAKKKHSFFKKKDKKVSTEKPKLAVPKAPK